jgi:GNAT superfamily N-acetyltransferase
MLVIKRTTVADRDFMTLVVDLDKEFWVRYPDTQQNFEPYNKVDQKARVVVAYVDDRPIGCGCFRPMAEAGTIEIKRMYVVPDARGNSVAKSILLTLEQWGREEAFTLCKLETGVKQPEAIAVYRKAGYKEIPNYPPYVDIGQSICMEKLL